MTQTQYINPECTRFNISGVDYYVHPKSFPFGVSMDAKFINVETNNVQTPSKTMKQVGKISARRLIALAFIPNPNEYFRSGRKFGDDNSLSIENTEWTNRRNERRVTTLLTNVETNEILATFDTYSAAIKFVNTDPNYLFTNNHHALSSKKYFMSKCGTFALVSA